MLLNVSGVLVVVGDSTEDERPLVGVVEGVGGLLVETVLDCVVLLFVVTVVVNVSDTVVAVVTAIVMMLFELTLCDLTGGLRGDGGTCATQGIT